MAADLAGAALTNLLSVPVLFFALGLFAAFVRSDLEIPPQVGKALSLFLMAAIGFKGGLELSWSPWSVDMALVAVVGISLSALTPWVAYIVLRKLARLDTPTAAAVAATYGSVSVVTFVTASAFLLREGLEHAGYLVAVLALMETPAIVAGLILARRAVGANGPLLPPAAMKEALTSGSVLLLLGALVIGFATGESGAVAVGPVFLGGFQGILALFLLEMGLLCARRLRDGRRLGTPLIAYALLFPLACAILGLGLARIFGLGIADGTMLAVLAASASYIAVPAAMRVALPEADPSVYVTLSLAVTFPMNVLLGIPLYFAMAQQILPG